MVENEPNTADDEMVSSGKTSLTGKKFRKVRHFRMIVMEGLKLETITPFVAANGAKESVIDSDRSNSYSKLKEAVKEYHHQIIPKKDVGKILLWVHIAISNAKKQLPNIYHQIASQYLQNYLNEFCYKFNRWYFGKSSLIQFDE